MSSLSDQQKDETTLRLMKERAQLRRTREELEQKLETAGRALIEMGSPMSGIRQAANAEAATGAVARHSDLLDGCALAGMVRDYVGARARLSQIDEALRELGIE